MTWPTKKLGEVCEIISPGIKKFEGSKKYVATADVSLDRIINFTGITYNHRPSRANIETKENDVLVARMAETKKFLIVDKKLQDNYIFSTGFAVLRIKKDLLPKCLFYFLTTKDFNLQKDKLAVGATQKAINNPALKRIKIPLLPLKIQKQIVERLDKIAEAQKLNDDLIQKSDELFQSLLHKEFNPTGKDWEAKKLEEIIVDTTNGFASRPVAKGVGQLRPNNIDSSGALNFSSIKFVPESYRNIKDYFLKKDDILFNNTNSVELVGKTAFIDKDYDHAFSNHMTRIRVDGKRISPQFLAIFLQRLYSMGKFRFLCTQWVNQAAVNTMALKRLKISLPPLKIQKQIVEKLSAAQDYKTQLLAQRAKLKELFDSVLHKSVSNK